MTPTTPTTFSTMRCARRRALHGAFRAASRPPPAWRTARRVGAPQAGVSAHPRPPPAPRAAPGVSAPPRTLDGAFQPRHQTAHSARRRVTPAALQALYVTSVTSATCPAGSLLHAHRGGRPPSYPRQYQRRRLRRRFARRHRCHLRARRPAPSNLGRAFLSRAAPPN